MKIKQVYNPAFDDILGYIGGFDNVPTKQDKFKPLSFDKLYAKNSDSSEELIEGEFYISNNKNKEQQKNFEKEFIEIINNALKENHPYPIDTPLEVVINIKMSEKRLKSVDVDNLAKYILDLMKGKLFVEDSQVRSLYIAKDVIKDNLVPMFSGVTIGIINLKERESLLAGIKFYDFVEISDEEYYGTKRKENEQG